MTFSASRHTNGNIVVRCAYGPVSFEAQESGLGATMLWGALGRELFTPEARAQRGYERYTAHLLVTSDEVITARPWDDLDKDTQSHWIAAFTEW